jgi:8-amino-7-oxononanoate synthase
MTLSDRWSAILEELRQQGRYRTLTAPAGIDFSSNDYLGYGSGVLERGVRDQESETGTQYSVLSTQYSVPIPGPLPRPPLSRSGLASRLLRGNHAIWEEVEATLCCWHDCKAALMMTSGYAANVGLLATVVEAHDWVASDALNHASLIDGLRLARAERFIYRHHDLDHLETGLHAAAQMRSRERQLFVVTESLFGMDGDLAPLKAIADLAQRYEAHMIVDEAHATGCFGPVGSGAVDALGLRARILASVHTGGKALGVAGAYICGSAQLRELLINRCRHFIYTTMLPAALGTWWLEALARVRVDHAGRSALHAGTATFRAELARQGVRAGGAHYIIPVVLGTDARAVQAADRLRQAGWDIRAIRPPSVPPGSARLRISIHADHPRETLVAAAAAVASEVQSTEYPVLSTEY